MNKIKRLIVVSLGLLVSASQCSDVLQEELLHEIELLQAVLKQSEEDLEESLQQQKDFLDIQEQLRQVPQELQGLISEQLLSVQQQLLLFPVRLQELEHQILSLKNRIKSLNKAYFFSCINTTTD